MNLNLLLVIMAVVLICMVMDGYKKGKISDLSDLPADYLCGAVPDREWSEQLL